MVKWEKFTGGDLIMKMNLRKSKVSYTVMIISDSAQRHHKEFHIRAGAVWAVSLFAFSLLVGMVCYVLYSSITLSDAMERSKVQVDEINRLNEVNAQLEVEKQELEGKIVILSETVNQKVEEERVRMVQDEQAHLPNGFPLSGTAQFKNSESVETQQETEDTETEDGEAADEGAVPMQAKKDKKEIILTASAGIHVIATGAGVVTEVGTDADYGNVITIDHGNGYVSSYRNGGEAMVKVGSEVTRGAILFVGGEENTDTGYSISKDDTYVDPMEMIEING